MDLKNKLKGLPPILLLHLDERKDRLEYTETQYEYWKIKNYQKCSGSKYQVSTYEEWKDLVILNDFPENYKRKTHHIAEISITLSHLINIKNWLETSNDQYVIIMEDDYDLNLIEYWHFDWEYLMNNIPYDWDCIQFSFENQNIIPCFLHPILSGHSTGASLINRRYAEKIINLHYKDGKFDLSQKICNYKWSPYGIQYYKGLGMPNFTTDYFLGHNGKTYCLPLVTVNNEFGSYSKNIIRKNERVDLEFSRKAYKKWWTTIRDEYSLKEFFIYGKPNDRFITKSEPELEKYV
jgi:hypothetical protein